MTSSLDARLDANAADLARLIDRATYAAAARRPSDAAAWVQTAATHAWLNPSGWFASPALEGLAGRLAEQVPEDSRRPRAVRGRPGVGVLHVVTQAYQTGGSTQYVASWIDQDARHPHCVCLTRQGAAPVPEKLRLRRSATVNLTRVDGASGLLCRAARLRSLAHRAELVVVHAHPYDAVVTLAFSGVPDLPPVVYVNQADHVFWLGTSTFSTLLNMRTSGAELARRRRGVGDDRSVVAARPLQPRTRRLERGAAKAELGLSREQIVIATMADGSKYRALEGPSLLDLVLPTLRSHPEVVLVAAGPAAEGEWATAEREAGGRVRALGLLDDPTVVQQAADVYLDSFPFSSLTSLLETGSLGTPTVTFAGHPDGCEVLGADTPGVDEQMFRPRTPAELSEVLAALVEDGALRERAGRLMASSIADTHVGSGWRGELDKVVRHATQPAGPMREHTVVRRTETLDRVTLAVMERTGYGRGLRGAVRDNLGLFSLPTRVGLIDEAGPGRVDTVTRALLPEHTRARAARSRAQLRRALPAAGR